MLGERGGGDLVWWGEAVMGNGARRESGFDGMGSSGSGLGLGRRGFRSEGGR